LLSALTRISEPFQHHLLDMSQVQTVRVATNPFGQWLSYNNERELLDAIRRIDAAAEVSRGPPPLPDRPHTPSAVHRVLVRRQGSSF
jgi:hypothetical protein